MNDSINMYRETINNMEREDITDQFIYNLQREICGLNGSYRWKIHPAIYLAITLMDRKYITPDFLYNLTEMVAGTDAGANLIYLIEPLMDLKYKTSELINNYKECYYSDGCDQKRLAIKIGDNTEIMTPEFLNGIKNEFFQQVISIKL